MRAAPGRVPLGTRAPGLSTLPPMRCTVHTRGGNGEGKGHDRGSRVQTHSGRSGPRTHPLRATDDDDRRSRDTTGRGLWSPGPDRAARRGDGDGHRSCHRARRWQSIDPWPRSLTSRPVPRRAGRAGRIGFTSAPRPSGSLRDRRRRGPRRNRPAHGHRSREDAVVVSAVDVTPCKSRSSRTTRP